MCDAVLQEGFGTRRDPARGLLVAIEADLGPVEKGRGELEARGLSASRVICDERLTLSTERHPAVRICRHQSTSG
jgi:hypothetical protein